MKKAATLISIIALTACGQMENKKAQTDNSNLTTVSAPADWKTYIHDNYSIQYPSTWKVWENKRNKSINFRNPSESDNTASIGVIDPKTWGITPEKYMDTLPAMLKKEYSIISCDKLKNKLGEYTQFMLSEDGDGFHLLWEERYYIIDGNIFCLLFYSFKGNWDVDKPIGEQILNSFSIKQ